MANNCPNCDIELEYASVSDAIAGDIYIDASCEYCPECLYVTNEKIQPHK